MLLCKHFTSGQLFSILCYNSDCRTYSDMSLTGRLVTLWSRNQCHVTRTFQQEALFHRFAGPRVHQHPLLSRKWPLLQNSRNIRGRTDAPKRRSLAPVDQVSGHSNGFSALARPFAYMIGVSTVSFTGAAVWQYEALRVRAQRALKGLHGNYTDRFFGKAGSFRHHLHVWWQNISNGERLAIGIIAANLLVFLAWRIPSLQGVMIKWFSSNPFGGAPCWSMLLSNFSHYSFLHIFANMYVFWSFTPVVLHLLGREQFLGFYLSAGVFSAFTSYILKVSRVSLMPSLGASGAIMAIIGAVCCYYPESRLSIAFVDQLIPHSFSAKQAVTGLVIFDSLGVLLGWRLFDHAAHLGGMLFGLWYATYGHKIIWANREPVMKMWHQFRGKP